MRGINFSENGSAPEKLQRSCLQFSEWT